MGPDCDPVLILFAEISPQFDVKWLICTELSLFTWVGDAGDPWDEGTDAGERGGALSVNKSIKLI